MKEHECHMLDLSTCKNLCYVKLRKGKYDFSEEFNDTVIDFDKKGNVLAVEFLDRL